MGGHLSTRVCDLLDCRYPIVLAGMGGVARSELVTAVTNAGEFGISRHGPRTAEPDPSGSRGRSPRYVPAVRGKPHPRRNRQRACSKVNFACALTLLFRLSRCSGSSFRAWSSVSATRGVLVAYQVGSAKEGEVAQRAGAHILIAQGVEAFS